MPASLNLSGVNRGVGTPLAGIPHLRQSITDIITTPVGSRVMRPEYGSHLPRMVDLPAGKGWISSVQAEVSRAIGRWEPRLKFSRCIVTAIENGRISLSVYGAYLGESVLLEVIA
jgi:phage baseplate assembly protein W